MIAFVAVLLLTVGLALVFSSPDEKPVTISQWATAAPKDFLCDRALGARRHSGVATYGPPYTHVAGAGQNIIGHLSIERLLGVQIPIAPARAFVLAPLTIPAASDPTLAAALLQWERATAAQKRAWANAYGKALDAGKVVGKLNLAPGNYGPLPTLMSSLLQMARSGGLDGALTESGRFYQTQLHEGASAAPPTAGISRTSRRSKTCSEASGG